jgi:hypothetical protein
MPIKAEIFHLAATSWFKGASLSGTFVKTPRLTLSNSARHVALNLEMGTVSILQHSLFSALINVAMVNDHGQNNQPLALALNGKPLDMRVIIVTGKNNSFLLRRESGSPSSFLALSHQILHIPTPQIQGFL